MNRSTLTDAYRGKDAYFWPVAKWFLTKPNYPLYCPTKGEWAPALTTRTETFESSLKLYMVGGTLCRVLKDVQEFQQFDNAIAPQLIRYSLDVMEGTFLLNEWYEIMPRFKYARNRIERTLIVDKPQ